MTLDALTQSEPAESRDRGDGPASNAPQGGRAVASHSEPAHGATIPDDHVQARGDRQLTSDPQSRVAVVNPSDQADVAAIPLQRPPGRGRGHCARVTHTMAASATLSVPAIRQSIPGDDAQGQGDGQPCCDDQSRTAVATIVDLWRQRVDLRRAEGRLNLQALAVCRRANGGDKALAQAAWGAVQSGKDADPALAIICEPYRQAMAGLDASAKALEKELARLVRPLPLAAWAMGVRGVGELSVAGLIGEAAALPSEYKSVSAVWKRFGLAVIDGGRQRRVADAEGALRHGYAPQRRAFAYVLSTQLMRCQREGDPYRTIYDERKAYELARDIPKAHAHNRALRVMVKALLRDSWISGRREPAA